MRGPFSIFAPAALFVLALVLPTWADAATRTPKNGRPPAPTPTAPYQGPPAPTPARYLRAAGSCMEFTPGRYLVLAEVGSTGRVFRIDEKTRIETEVKKGARLRVLYVDRPEGPVARKILPGPVASPRAPLRP